MKFRIVRALAKLVVVLSSSAFVAGAYLFYRAMPAYSGPVALPGLNGETRVWRDAYGVPHIFAPQLDDAARALGYLHASERLYQMEVNRRVGQGRLAELAGPSLVEVDRFIRTLGFYRLAESSFAALSPCGASALAGLCRWRQRLPRRATQRAAAGIPHPRRQSGTLEAGRFAGLGQADVAATQRQLRDGGLARAPATEVAADQARLAVAGAAARLADHHRAGRLRHAITRRTDDRVRRGSALLHRAGHGASNEWVIAGSRTVTGKPILANDPHLDLAAPILWYLARIVTPEGSVKGATVPGLPLVLLGQNDHIAWGFTTSRHRRAGPVRRDRRSRRSRRII